MQTTTKTTTNNFNIGEAAQHAGLVMMTLAATLGMVELPHESSNSKAMVNAQPAFVFAAENQSAGHENPQRRDKEEVHPHSASYSATQRTPGRTGKI
ncbi:MAG: hypothetical protein JWO35_318 [Candidatus Saccharibacteria bacterium]|nr:hypothetical protein [Candidatus Saccharibacteria bacterium]